MFYHTHTPRVVIESIEKKTGRVTATTVCSRFLKWRKWRVSFTLFSRVVLFVAQFTLKVAKIMHKHHLKLLLQTRMMVEAFRFALKAGQALHKIDFRYQMLPFSPVL